MQLIQISNGMVIYGTDGNFEIPAGDKFVIKVSGNKVLNERVPAGKKWTVTISMKVEEEDV